MEKNVHILVDRFYSAMSYAEVHINRREATRVAEEMMRLSESEASWGSEAMNTACAEAYKALANYMTVISEHWSTLPLEE